MKKFLAVLLCGLGLVEFSASPARAQFADQQTYVATTQGTANAQLAAVANYNLDLGVVIRANVSATNTGPMTLNVNGSGVVPVKKPSNSGLLPLAAGDVVQGQIAQFVFDGVEFQLLNPASVSLLNTVVYCTSFMNAAQVADGINRTDSIDVAAAINSCLAAAVGLKAPAYLQAGTWKVSGARVVQNYAGSLANGINFYGDGPQNTILDAQASAANPPFLIEATGGSTGSPVSAVYGGWQKMALLGNVAGPVLQDGQNDFSDFMNQQYFQQVSIQNFNATSSSTCGKFNAVFSPAGISNNCSSAAGASGGNDLWQFEKVSFGAWIALGGSSGQNFLHITNDVSAGNGFYSIDCEIVAVCVKIDTANGVENSFYSGTWAYSTNGVQESAGGDNHAFVPNINGNSANFLSGPSVGLFEIWNNTTLASLVSPIFSGSISLANPSGTSTLQLVVGALTNQLTTDSSGNFILSGAVAGQTTTIQQAGAGTIQQKVNAVDVADQTATLDTIKTHVALTGGTPTCGTGCATIGGNSSDSVMLANSGAGVTAMTVNFGTTWAATPMCVATLNTAAVTYGVTALTTGLITLGFSGATTATAYIHCFQG